jgi:endoglucanase
VVADIMKRTTAAGHAIVEQTQRMRIRVSLLAKDYVWGSNGVAANYGMELPVANVLAPDPTFVESAQDDLYYLLGAEYIFTFVDDASWDESLPHPRHRPSGADAGP